MARPIDLFGDRGRNAANGMGIALITNVVSGSASVKSLAVVLVAVPPTNQNQPWSKPPAKYILMG